MLFLLLCKIVNYKNFKWRGYIAKEPDAVHKPVCNRGKVSKTYVCIHNIFLQLINTDGGCSQTQKSLTRKFNKASFGRCPLMIITSKSSWKIQVSTMHKHKLILIRQNTHFLACQQMHKIVEMNRRQKTVSQYAS